MRVRPADHGRELEEGEVERASGSDRLAAWAFAGFLAVAAPLVLFRLGTFRWFSGDDIYFLAWGRLGNIENLFHPFNGHWTTVPFIVYRLLWHVVGLKSYLPYQAVLLAVHLTVAVLLRLVALRAGARPWIATVAAASFVLFGPGSDDIVWAFQIAFTGALAFGLGQLLLTDHDGGFDRRDALGIASGLLALMCSGVGVAMAIAVGGAVLLRRGWKLAAIQTVPLAGAYALYTVIQHPQVESRFGRPPIGAVLRWMWSTQVGTFQSLGHYALVGVALGVLLVVGFALAWFRPGRAGESRTHRLAMPTGLLLGGVVFSALTVQARWQFGAEAAKSNRYIYLGAAFTLPALAVAAEELARRRRELIAVVIALLMVAIPANAAGFEGPVFNRAFFDHQRRIILTTPRLPFVERVPADITLLPGGIPRTVNVGFLRRAAREGRLPAANGRLAQATVDEFRVRLGVSQHTITTYPSVCHEQPGPLRIDPERGEVRRVVTPVAMSIVEPGRTTPRVVFLPAKGQLLEAELPDLHLLLEPYESASITTCDWP